jgi:hypothetical protein
MLSFAIDLAISFFNLLIQFEAFEMLSFSSSPSSISFTPLTNSLVASALLMNLH